MLTENERLILIKKKEEIGETTGEIIQLFHDNPDNKVAIDIKLNKVLELLSTIASFSESDRDINKFTRLSVQIMGLGKVKGNPLGYKMMRIPIETFCAAANSVTFKFTKTGIQVKIPKIDVSIFKNEF